VTRQRKPRRGDRVRVERDEERWPPKGSWRTYRGREGTVVTVNRTDREYGVSFVKVRDRGDGSLAGPDAPTWFAEHELVLVEQG
jgi:hypothetical protein